MSRRANAHVRCERCRVHKSLCFCEHIPRLATRTQLLLLIHRREVRKSTNTGTLAARCLANSQVVVRGFEDPPDHDLGLDPTRQHVLLFPGETAQPLADYADSSRPVTLIVPDGNWRQASKMCRRVSALAQVQRVGLPAGPPTLYRLRHESREGGLATMEAIARALGVLEGTWVRDALERVFRIMTERTLWARGALETGQVADGLPQFAQRHDPTSGVGRAE